MDKFGDPLVLLKKTIPWELFRSELKAVWRLPDKERKSRAGRKPWDEVLMFRVLVLQQLYNLSDDQIEYQVRDRLSFMRFLDLGVEDRVPDAKTVWLYREKLAQAGMVKTLFDRFDAYLRDNGYLAMGGKLIRTVGMAQAKTKIGMMNLVYNMNRFIQLETGAAAPG